MQSRSPKVDIFGIKIRLGNQDFELFPIYIIHLVLCDIICVTFY